MYKVILSKTFKKSLNKLRKSGKFGGKAQERLGRAIDILADGEALPRIYQDHKLIGGFTAQRECHIKGDLVFVYEIREHVLVLLAVDIGTHAQIFG